MSLSNSVINSTLLEVGVNPALSGYGYIGEAIRLVYDDPEQLRFITKKLYPSIAEKVGSTPSRVERAIRHAVECVFDSIDTETSWRYFGNVIRIGSGKVTNTTFIACLVNHIRDEIEKDGTMREEEHYHENAGSDDVVGSCE